MKKIFLTIAFLSSILAGVSAQQEFQYTQFMYNKLLLNPGYAGARGVPFVSAIYRNQWIGFEGAPVSALASFNMPMPFSQRVGAGLTLSHRSIGLQKEVYGSLAYSYDLLINDQLSCRFGIQGSAKSFGLNLTKAQPLVNDMSLSDQKESDFLMNIGAGLFALYRDQYYLGFSVPTIYRNRLNNYGLDNTDAQNEALESPHFYLMGGGSFPLSEELALMPAFLVKYVKNAPIDADLNVNLDIKKKFTVGLSYRLGGDDWAGESVDLLFYFQANSMIGIGAAYDFTLTQIKDYSSGSVEVLAQIDLKQKKNNMSNPRFFF